MISDSLILRNIFAVTILIISYSKMNKNTFPVISLCWYSFTLSFAWFGVSNTHFDDDDDDYDNHIIFCESYTAEMSLFSYIPPHNWLLIWPHCAASAVPGMCGFSRVQRGPAHSIQPRRYPSPTGSAASQSWSQRGWWQLKSPRIRASSHDGKASGSNRSSRPPSLVLRIGGP